MLTHDRTVPHLKPARLVRAVPVRWLSHHTRRSSPEASAVKGLRRRRPKDLGACQRLLRVVFYERQYPVYWPDAPRAWLDGEDLLGAWVVERQGEILGHVGISRVGLDVASAVRWREITGHPASELAAVSRLFVRRRVREQGIGTALLNLAAAEIRAHGLMPVLEVVSLSSDAVTLVDQCGWRLLSMDPWGDRTERMRLFRYAAPAEDRTTLAP